jgi:mannose-1-phosphate guanylyltransferase/mannose-6-phosphate isomerase
MKIVILAGGVGSRLWPYSKDNFPKQFLKFSKNYSLLQETILRFKDASFVKEIIIVTNQNYFLLTKNQISMLDINKKIEILIEPDSKNTYPAIFLSLKYLEEKFFLKENEKVLILPSDHIISPIQNFLDVLEKLEHKNLNEIITFGIRPTKPETGYGYIKVKEKKEDLLSEVLKFHEKPEIEKAKEYLMDKNFYWNLGIFLFSKKIFFEESKKYIQNFSTNFNLSYQNFLKNFDNLENISIDKALLEKTRKISLCTLDISWSDVGSWDSIYDLLEKDHNNNAILGNVITVDTKNSLIISNKKLISLIGVDDLIVIETDDTIFITKKNSSSKTKDLLKKLKNIALKNNYASKSKTLLVNRSDDKKR